MGFRNLSIGAMVVQGNYFLTPAPKGAKDVLDSDPLLSLYGVKIDGATQPLLTYQRQVGVLQGEIVTLTQSITEKDDMADVLIGGIDDGLSGAIAVCQNTDLKLALDMAQITIFETGRRSLVHARYSAVGGIAELIEERLTQPSWDALEQVKIGDEHLADALRRWFSLAGEISDIETHRSELQVEDDKTKISRAQVLKLRNIWIRTIKAFTSAVELSDLSEEASLKLLAPLYSAVKKAERADQKADVASSASE